MMSDITSVLGEYRAVLEELRSYHLRTHSHCIRVGELCDLFARQAGFVEVDKDLLVMAGLLHDIGKLDIPITLLDKEEPLSKKEWEQLKLHPLLSTKYVSDIGVLEIIKNHHRYGGYGYPQDGSPVPFFSEVIGVLDGFDAMTHKRPYHPCFSVPIALSELINCSGRQYNPVIVQDFVRFNNYSFEKLSGD